MVIQVYLHCACKYESFKDVVDQIFYYLEPASSYDADGIGESSRSDLARDLKDYLYWEPVPYGNIWL